MRRREFIAGLSACSLGLPFSLRAQTDGLRRIGVLLPGSPDSYYGEYLPAFVKGLEELGYVRDRDFVLDVEWGEGRTEQLPVLAERLVKRQVDLIFLASSLAANAALKATATIPIVQASGASPVGTGAAASLSRPQSNITGFTNQSEDVAGKLLELLTAVVPNASLVGVLMVPGAPVTPPQMKQMQEAAEALRVAIHPIGISDAAELEGAFQDFLRENVGGLVVFSAALLTSVGGEVVELALRTRIPAIYPYPNFAAQGGLMAYGTDLRRQYHASARFVDRILKGARPGDLPIEQPTKLDLISPQSWT